MSLETPHYWLPNAARHFEVNRNREVKRMNWFAMPTDLSSELWVELADHPNGAAHIGVFVAVAMLASRGTPRWHLLDELGRPHTDRTVSRVSRLPIALVQEAFERFILLGQLATLPQDGATSPHSPAATPHDGATFPQDTAVESHPSATSPQEGAQYREKKREEERREESANLPATTSQQGATRSHFQPDVDRFRREYPKPASQLEVQFYVGAMNSPADESQFFASLAAHKRTEQWKDSRYIPSAKTFISEGRWRTIPVVDDTVGPITPIWRPEDYE